MLDPYLSVIIPTFNRRSQLETCLGKLKQQNLSSDAYEVIVVNDGSTDETNSFLNTYAQSWPVLKVIHQNNTGQGTARNNAINLAKGQVTLFIGDDIYATPEFLQTHIKFHQENPEPNLACLGLTQWDTNQEITQFMDWLTNGGPQFAYHKLIPKQEASFWFFYTSNISLKTALLKQNQFDTDFSAYGWEDIELGYRLSKQNLKLIYTPTALAFHDHPMKPQELKKKMQGVAKNAKLFQSKHPEIQVIPKGPKLIALQIIGSWPVIFAARLLGKRAYWYALSKRYSLKYN